MKTAYSLLVFISISVVAAGPVPVNRDGVLVRRTQVPTEVTPSAVVVHPSSMPAPSVDVEAQKQAEEQAGMIQWRIIYGAWTEINNRQLLNIKRRRMRWRQCTWRRRKQKIKRTRKVSQKPIFGHWMR